MIHRRPISIAQLNTNTNGVSYTGKDGWLQKVPIITKTLDQVFPNILDVGLNRMSESKDVLLRKNRIEKFLQACCPNTSIPLEIERIRFEQSELFLDEVEVKYGIAPRNILSEETEAINSVKRWLGTEKQPILFWVRDSGAIKHTGKWYCERLEIIWRVSSHYLLFSSFDREHGIALLKREYDCSLREW